MIKFSIITVCLNAGNDLLETVESTLKQSYSEFEIIVKDGFSKDESICKLPQDKRIHLVQKKDTGIYDAMNQGIEVAQGDYMIFMNAGDKFYDSEVLKRIADGIEETSGDLYYGRCYNQILDVVDPAPKKLTKYFCYRSMICHQATIYKTNMLKKRGYDVSYTVSADRERILSILTVLPLLVNAYVEGLYYANTLANKIKGSVIITTIFSVASIGTEFLLLKTINFNPLIVIAGTSSCYMIVRHAVVTPLYCAYVLKLPKMTFYPALIKSVAISCVIYVLFEGVRRVVIIGSWFKFLFVCAGVGILGYVLVLILLFNKDERKKVLQMVLKRKSK